MNQEKILFKVALIFLNISFVYSQGITVEPPVIELGNIELGVTIETEVNLINRTNGDLYVEKIITNCGCQKPILNENLLKPGKQITMKIQTMRDRIGFFRNEFVLLHRDTSLEPVRIRINGHAVSTLLTKVGWMGTEMSTIQNYKDYININNPLKNNEKLQISIKDINKKKIDEKFISKVRSEYFYVKEDGLQINDEEVVMLLELKQKLKDGWFKDTIDIETADKRRVATHILFNINDGIVIEPSTLHLQCTSIKSPPPKKFFCLQLESETELWEEVAWNVSGSLSDSISIELEEKDIENKSYKFSLNLIPDIFMQKPNGFYKAFIEVYDKKNKDTVQRILVFSIR